MRSSIFISLAAAVLMTAGCSQKRPTVLSGDNSYEMQSSIVTLSSTLTPTKRVEFEQAVATIVFQANDRRTMQAGDRLTPESIRMLKGRSVNQVIESAKLLRTIASY